jgi:hypothetical protein
MPFDAIRRRQEPVDSSGELATRMLGVELGGSEQHLPEVTAELHVPRTADLERRHAATPCFIATPSARVGRQARYRASTGPTRNTMRTCCTTSRPSVSFASFRSIPRRGAPRRSLLLSAAPSGRNRARREWNPIDRLPDECARTMGVVVSAHVGLIQQRVAPDRRVNATPTANRESRQARDLRVSETARRFAPGRGLAGAIPFASRARRRQRHAAGPPTSTPCCRRGSSAARCRSGRRARS